MNISSIVKISILCIITNSGFITAQNSIYLDVNQPIEKRVENALSLMTLDEKVAMCHAQSTFSSKGVPRLGIPDVDMSDGPHGVRAEVKWDGWVEAGWTNDSCLAFPALTCLAATFNPRLSHSYGVALGEEARYRNKEIILGPGVNIYRTPLNGRNFEYMGEDPYLASKMVVPYIVGVQETGVAACLKHFALNNQETTRFKVDVQVSDRALREIYLPAFKAGVMEGKVWSVMGSYNSFRGEHCCHNDLLLSQILKGEWKFDGVVVSDWGGTHNTLQSINNGLDIEMGKGTNGFSKGAKNTYDYYYLADPYKKLLMGGETSVAVLDGKVRRILRLIFRTSMSKDRPWGSMATEQHSTIARTVAEEGIVLLKNSSDFLPLNIESFKNIAVIGENASRSLTVGGGSSGLKVKYEVSPLEGIKNQFGSNVNITYSKGYSSGPAVFGKEIASTINADSLLLAAVKVAKNADIIIYIGGLNKNYRQDCEDGDRRGLELPFGQDKLLTEILKVNKKVVVVNISGNAVAMPWVNDVPAIIQSWYNGSEAGNAIASVLTGKVNPSGKLPFSFPVKLKDVGAHSFGNISYPGINMKEEYKEDILVGYRWFETKKIKPLFPFGYGLSYTTFEYGKMTADKKIYSENDVMKLSFTIKNIGKKDGAEIVQVYASQPKASVLRPVKELKGFQKIFLKVGETKNIEMAVKVKDLAFFNDKTQSWLVEQGEFVLYNAASSADVKSEVQIQVK